jgi:hypothetical protein
MPSQLNIPPPQSSAVLLEIVLDEVIFKVPLLYIPPPQSSVVLPEIVLPVIVKVPPLLYIPPPIFHRHK